MAVNPYSFSTTPGSNTSVGGVNIDEGWSASSVNNAIRATMAGTKEILDAISGAKTTAGTANAQTLTTGLALAAGAGVILGFKAGALMTNTTAMTLAVDSIAAKSVKLVDGSDPPAGAITAAGIYLVAFQATADVWQLLNPTPTTAVGANPQFTTIELGDASNTTISRVGAGVIAVEGSTVAMLGTEDQTLAGGVRVTVKDLGSTTGATITPDPGDRPMQKCSNNGAWTLAPGSNVGSYLLEVINTTGAAVPTTSGWTKVEGAFNTTTTSKFICQCIVTSNFSYLNIASVV